jgi:hypothetical protein
MALAVRLPLIVEGQSSDRLCCRRWSGVRPGAPDFLNAIVNSVVWGYPILADLRLEVLCYR